MSDYNGWTNYETWAVNLHLDNEEGTYLLVRRMARDAIREGRRTGETGRRILADALKELHESEAPSLPLGVYSDLLGAALDRVNWYEIADHHLADETDETEEEEEGVETVPA